jgi:hypothetical protein
MGFHSLLQGYLLRNRTKRGEEVMGVIHDDELFETVYKETNQYYL